MKAAKQLLFYYLAGLLVLLVSWYLCYISTYDFFIIMLMMLSLHLLGRFLYPFRRCERKLEECHYFWKIYVYFCVINLFALTLYTIIDVAMDNELTSFFWYWFLVLLGSAVPFAVYGIYHNIQMVRHGGDKNEERKGMSQIGM